MTIQGMLYNVRDMGGFAFLILRNRDGLHQCVLNKAENEEVKYKQESALRITGEERAEERAPGGVEIVIENIEVLSAPAEEAPVVISKYNLNVSLENELPLRPFVLRHPKRAAMFKLSQGIVQGYRRYLEDSGFTEIHTPKIGAGAAEGGTNVFTLGYFEKEACLAQSPQFYKQMLVPVYERVFEIGPVFRAEKHDTARHLNEYISMDFEMGFIDSFYDITNMQQGAIKYILSFLKENYAKQLATLKVEVPEINGDIPCLKFAEAKERVAEKYNRKIRDPFDLEPEEERLISELVKDEYGCDFAFITHYPAKKRPFYAIDDPEDNKYTLSFDLLFRGTEITTGGQRIHDYEMQKEKMLSKGLNPDDFESYLMLHKYGAPPHGGLGMGLERFLMCLTEVKNVREVSMFPRDTGRLTP
jgi:aspartyl-tRNA synthetase, archaeal type